MPRKSLIIICGISLVAGVAFFARQIQEKLEYDKLRDRMFEVPHFSTHPMDDEAIGFLESVRDSWRIQIRESPDPIFAQISSVTGLEESVEGVVALYTHEIPEYFFVDRRRNAKEAVMAVTLAVALPVSLDGRVYVEDGLAFTKLSENCVEVYEDGKRGLARTVYFNPIPADKAVGESAGTPHD